MNSKSRKFQCPLCGSSLAESRYYEIMGLWEERSRLENSLKDQLRSLKEEKRKLQDDKRQMKAEMEKLMKQKVNAAREEGRLKEKKRAERLSKMIEGKTQELQKANAKIKELEEQLKKGTTPQVEGLNLEEEIAKELQRTFPEDSIEHHGKNGDILHRVNYKRKQIGLILYECKKTAKFQNSYIDQTKNAVASRNATYGVLVTTASKKETAGFWVERDILVVHPYGAIFIAEVLRRSIIEVNSLKISHSEMEKRAKELMQYMKSDDFKNCVEDSIDRAEELRDSLVKEMKTHKRVWEDRFNHYKKIHHNVSCLEAVTSNIMNGIPAKQALKRPPLKQLPPPEL